MVDEPETGRLEPYGKRLSSPGCYRATLDLALRVLRSALSRPTLTEQDAIEIIEYHLQRNRTARKSHRKTWLRNHKNVRFKLLL